MEGLIGRFEHSLDGKGRVVLPARFRPAFAAGGFLARGKLGAIELWTPEAFEAHLGKLRDKADRADEDDEDLKAHRIYMAFSAADEVQVDTQGRIAVNGRLQRYARLAAGDKVVVTGADRTVQLWNPDLWESMIADPHEDDLHRPPRSLRLHTEDS